MAFRDMSLLVEQIRGVSYKPEDVHDCLDASSITLLRANNIVDGAIELSDVVYVDRKCVIASQILRRGDILICASSGSKNLVGKAAQFLLDGEYTFGAFCKVVRPKETTDFDYISMFFQSPAYRREISSVAIGVNINNIRNEHIDSLRVSWPGADARKAIVRQLQSLMTVMQSRQSQLRTLDTLIKARFVEMFGDIKENPKKYSMIDVKSIVDSCEAGWSGNGTQREKKDGEIAVLKVSSVTKGYFIPEECKVLDDQENIKKRVIPEKGDLIFSRANTREMVGATAIIYQDYPELILPDKLWKIRFKEKANVFYMKYVLSSKHIRDQFSAASTGTSGSMYNVSMEKFNAIRIPLPAKEEQDSFMTLVNQINKSKSIVQKALNEAQLLFDSLMQQYFG